MATMQQAVGTMETLMVEFQTLDLVEIVKVV
jgi:hypothetical protein